MEDGLGVRVCSFLWKVSSSAFVVIAIRILSVRPELANLVKEVLVEEKLPNVLDTSTGNSIIRFHSHIRMRDNMDMVCPPAVVTREDGRQSRNTIFICSLGTTERSTIHATVAEEVVLPFVDDTSVHAGGISIPEIPPNPRDRLTGDVVDELALDDNRDTGSSSLMSSRINSRRT